jgi:Fe-S cluster biogenesis protein NfuA
MREKIIEVINKIRPALERDGGDIEFVGFDEKIGIIKVHLQGHCAHCPMSVMTLKEVVLRELQLAIPEIKNIETI